MATSTTNYGWTKPAYEDDADIMVINGTIDAIDSQMKSNETNILLNTQNGGGINKADFSLSNLMSANPSWTWQDNVASKDSQTITVNSDKTLTVHTTNSHGQLSFNLTTLSANQGDLYVSGCPSGGSASTYKIGVANIGYDVGNGIAVQNQTTSRAVFIEVSANVAIDLVFKPMVIDKSIHDSGFYGYQPYAMSNVELTNNISIEDVTSDYTAATGYTINSLTKIYKQGKHIFGQLVVSIDTGTIPTSGTIVATTTYKPVKSLVSFCGCGTDSFNVKSIGFVTISQYTGDITANDTVNTNSCLNMQIDYVCQ